MRRFKRAAASARPILILAVAFGLAAGVSISDAATGGQVENIATFSIVGFDPETGEVGVAVASKFLAVGSVVPWAEAGAGAVATQAFANTTYGPVGLALLKQGVGAQAVLDSLIAMDEGRDERQVGIVDTHGGSATYTGKDCIAWAGGKKGPNYACQGNILVDGKTVEAMAATFEKTTGALATRLVRALKAGDDAGGDSRGKQSAALYIAKQGGGYGGRNDRFIDLRVDDNEDPITELMRLLSIQMAYQALYKAMDLREAGDIPGAICELESARESCPGVAALHYDLACYYSLSGQKAKALEELEKAVAIAPEYKRMAVEDTDLQMIRGEAKFRIITE
jgi:uncharacterized Ntn-hydrolase superfamily protein